MEYNIQNFALILTWNYYMLRFGYIKRSPLYLQKERCSFMESAMSCGGLFNWLQFKKKTIKKLVY